MKSPSERVDAVIVKLADSGTAGAVLINLLGRLESAATKSNEGTACASYAKRRCVERSAALWAIAQAEASAASVAAAAAKAGGAA